MNKIMNLIWHFLLIIIGICEVALGYREVVDKNKFWSRVAKCLVEFHHFTIEEAIILIKNEQKIHHSMIYYKMPFDVANEIAGNDIRLPAHEYRKRYIEGICENEN